VVPAGSSSAPALAILPVSILAAGSGEKEIAVA